MRMAPVFISFTIGTMFEIIGKNLRIKEIKKQQKLQKICLKLHL